MLDKLMQVKGNLSRLVQKRQFYHLNRYSDIMVYENTRVKLDPRNPEENTYINACYVDSPFATNDNRLIASQGPLSNTVGDFWRMIS